MLTKFQNKYNIKTYRIDQFNKSFYQDCITNFNELTTWPKNLRKKLIKEIDFTTLEPKIKFISENKNTIKLLFKLKRNKKLSAIETVFIKHKNRNTICVSVMIGCPLKCKFCATGQMGFQANLTYREIIDQILYFQRLLKKQKNKVTNIVFMGMGEPLLNFKEVMKSIKILTDQKKFAISTRKITISTAGLIEPLKKLIDIEYKGKLAVSLHAPEQNLREKLMPIAKTNTLKKLFKILDKYVDKTNKRITYEYLMLKNVNDSLKHANMIVQLLDKRLSHVNLIPYNSINTSDFKKSNNKSINIFKTILEKNNITTTIRKSMGSDVSAACGQLKSIF